MFVVDNCLPRGKAKRCGVYPINFNFSHNFVSFRGIELGYGVTTATVQLTPPHVPRPLVNIRADPVEVPASTNLASLTEALDALYGKNLPPIGFEEGTKVIDSKHSIIGIYMYKHQISLPKIEALLNVRILYRIVHFYAKEIIKRLEACLAKKFKKITLQAYGSCRNGFAAIGSDRDITVDFRTKGLPKEVSEYPEKVNHFNAPTKDNAIANVHF